MGVIAIALSGCEAAIGDKCDSSSECPTGSVCDTDSPSGYCLVYNCEGDDDCPEGSVCVNFTKNLSYCLKKCKSKSDCDRSGYTCRDDIGETPFCYVAADYVYGRDEDNQIEYVAPDEDEP